MNFTSKHAIKITLFILTSVVLFHCCIILKIIPYEIAWGGRLKSDTEMYVFETLSIFINLFLLWVLLMKGAFVKSRLSHKAIQIILWVFIILFALNTIGNLFAKAIIEKVFSILTLGLSILLWHIVRNKKE